MQTYRIGYSCITAAVCVVFVYILPEWMEQKIKPGTGESRWSTSHVYFSKVCFSWSKATKQWALTLINKTKKYKLNKKVNFWKLKSNAKSFFVCSLFSIFELSIDVILWSQALLHLCSEDQQSYGLIFPWNTISFVKQFYDNQEKLIIDVAHN